MEQNVSQLGNNTCQKMSMRDENVEMNVRNNRKDKIKKWAHLKIGIASMGDQLRETFFFVLSYLWY